MNYIWLIVSCMTFGSLLCEESILIKKPQKPAQVLKKLRNQCYEEMGTCLHRTPQLIKTIANFQKTHIEPDLIRITSDIMRYIADFQSVCMREIENALEERSQGICQLTKEELDNLLAQFLSLQKLFSTITNEFERVPDKDRPLVSLASLKKYCDQFLGHSQSITKILK